MDSSQMPDGTICHLEIHASDLAKTRQFYTEFFGWETQDAMDTYAMWKDPHGAEGGFFTGGKSNDTENNMFLKVTDMEGMLAKLKDAGYEILREKTQISPEYGYMALFKDPGGNAVGLWSKE